MFMRPVVACRLLAAALATVSLLGAGWPQAKAVAAEPIELTYLTNSTCVAVVVYPSRIISSPDFEQAPIEVLQAVLEQYVGINPHDVEQVLITAQGTGGPHGTPTGALVARLSKSYSIDDLLPVFRRQVETAEFDGRTMLHFDDPFLPVVFMPDDTTIIVAQQDLLETLLASRSVPDSRLAEILAATGDEHDIFAVFDVAPIREVTVAVIGQDIPELPDPLEELKRLPSLLAALQLELNVTESRPSSLRLVAVDEPSAEQLEGILNENLDFGRQMMLSDLEGDLDTSDPVQQATLDYAQRVSGVVVEKLRPQRDGESLSLTFEPGPGQQRYIVAALSGITSAALAPLVQAAEWERRMSRPDYNLRQLGFAMLNYEAATARFPSAGGDEDERAGLSWRVHMLPYLEEYALYEQFNLDEPWDSEHNRALIDQMPAILVSPSADAAEGYTHYQLPVGEDTAFHGGSGPSFRDYLDGMSRTILVVEADEPVIWTKPDDWEFDADDPAAGVGGLYGDGSFWAVFGDGHTEQIPGDASPEMIKAFVTPDGEEALP